MSAQSLALRGSSARRIGAMVYRHVCLFRRSWPRVVELLYWPVLQMCIWGFISVYLAGMGTGPAVLAGSAFLGGVLLWEAALRSQFGFSIAFLEEMWSRNLGNLMIAPIRPWELVAALMIMGALRVLLGVGAAAILAWALYAFDVTSIGVPLIGFFGNLMLMGYAVGILVVAVILRNGQGAESLAWSLLFGLAPLSAVFYPVSVLPPWLQPVALAIPATHVFEGMRIVLAEGRFDLGHFFWACGLNAVLFAAAAWLFIAMFRAARERGLILNLGE